MQGVGLGRQGFTSQLFPILSPWLKPSMFLIALCTKILSLFLFGIKVNIGIIYLAELTYCLTWQLSVLFAASKHDCDANTVKGNSIFSTVLLIKAIRIVVTRSLLTGTRTLSHTLKFSHILFLLWYLHPASFEMTAASQEFPFHSPIRFSFKAQDSPIHSVSIVWNDSEVWVQLKERSIKEIPPWGEFSFVLTWANFLFAHVRACSGLESVPLKLTV